MTETDRIKRESVAIASLSVEGFQIADCSYRMSLSSAATAVGWQARNAFDVLRSKATERFLGAGFTPSITDVEENQPRQNSIKPWQSKGGDRS